VPHATSKDGEYMGYKIPAGAGLINNVWAINNGENRTPEPRRFNPDRYSGDTAWSGESAASSDPSKRDHFNFGAGCRICPSLHIADRSLFLAIARLAWAFKLSGSLDANGVPIPIERDALEPGYVVSCPEFP
ncbi:cytochrome P450, partial [Glonium stellatum]